MGDGVLVLFSASASPTATPPWAASASRGRFGYSAIGSVVNLAARLCGEARNGQILVDSKVHDVVMVFVDCATIGEIALKGIRRPVPVFNIQRLRRDPRDAE